MKKLALIVLFLGSVIGLMYYGRTETTIAVCCMPIFISIGSAFLTPNVRKGRKKDRYDLCKDINMLIEGLSKFIVGLAIIVLIGGLIALIFQELRPDVKVIGQMATISITAVVILFVISPLRKMYLTERGYIIHKLSEEEVRDAQENAESIQRQSYNG